jgi:hypothetical protein
MPAFWARSMFVLSIPRGFSASVLILSGGYTLCHPVHLCGKEVVACASHGWSDPRARSVWVHRHLLRTSSLAFGHLILCGQPWPRLRWACTLLFTRSTSPWVCTCIYVGTLTGAVFVARVGAGWAFYSLIASSSLSLSWALTDQRHRCQPILSGLVPVLSPGSLWAWPD